MNLIPVSDDSAAYTISYGGRIDTLWRAECEGLNDIELLALAWGRLSNGDVGVLRSLGLSYLNTRRGNHRSTIGLTESMYYETQRWLAAPDTPFGLDSQRGRMSREQYAIWVVATWEKIEADYNLAVSLAKQAKTVNELAIILARRR